MGADVTHLKRTATLFGAYFNDNKDKSNCRTFYIHNKPQYFNISHTCYCVSIAFNPSFHQILRRFHIGNYYKSTGTSLPLSLIPVMEKQLKLPAGGVKRTFSDANKLLVSVEVDHSASTPHLDSSSLAISRDM